MKNQRVLISFLLLGLILLSPAQAEETDGTPESEPAAASVPLRASITFPHADSSYNVNDKISFSGAAGGGEPPYAYTWDFGDGTTAFGQSYDKIYTSPGAKTVVLTITDFAGHTANAAVSVAIIAPTSPLVASILSPANNANIQTGVATTFAASGEGGQPPYAYTWDFGDGTTAFGQSYDKIYTSPGARTVIVTITDFAGARATASVNLTIAASPPPPPPPPSPDSPLTISNIRVSDITHNSAVIRWTTNRAASSRVIYDTVSHPSIAGQSAPNFGYGFSTGTLDTDPKVVEHTVTVSGLTPDLTYYFRVISQ